MTTPVPAQRFVKKGFYMVCAVCNLEARYCACAKQATAAASSAQDGAAAASLAQRIRACKESK